MLLKRLVHPKMKMFYSLSRHIGLYDFFLSDESNQSYIKYCPGYSKRCHCSGCFSLTVQKTLNKVCVSIIKRASHGSRRWIRSSCSGSIRFCKKNVHISNVIITFLSLLVSVVHGRRSGGWWRTNALLRDASLTSLFTGTKEAKFPFFIEILRHLSLQILGLYF